MEIAGKSQFIDNPQYEDRSDYVDSSKITVDNPTKDIELVDYDDSFEIGGFDEDLRADLNTIADPTIVDYDRVDHVTRIDVEDVDFRNPNREVNTESYVFLPEEETGATGTL